MIAIGNGYTLPLLIKYLQKSFIWSSKIKNNNNSRSIFQPILIKKCLNAAGQFKIVGQIVGYIKKATYVVKRHKWLIIMWEHTGSNRGPSACKADALNQLSYAPIIFGSANIRDEWYSKKFKSGGMAHN